MGLLNKKGILERGIGMFYAQLRGQFDSEEQFWTMLAEHCLEKLKKIKGENEEKVKKIMGAEYEQKM